RAGNVQDARICKERGSGNLLLAPLSPNYIRAYPLLLSCHFVLFVVEIINRQFHLTLLSKPSSGSPFPLQRFKLPVLLTIFRPRFRLFECFHFLGGGMFFITIAFNHTSFSRLDLANGQINASVDFSS